MEQLDTRFSQVDVLPMVKHYIDQLGLYHLFKKYVPAASDCLVDPADSLCLLTANIICANRPLYKVQEWQSAYSGGLTDEPSATNYFNDDRLGRALSALFKADRHTLMTEVSAKAIQVHQLETEEIHNDTTTVTFLGQYDHPDPEAVQLKHGHNKDFRPDCKQIVFGLNITTDGQVPLSYKLFDGNTVDDVTHIPNWNGLRSLLGKEDFIYVADCKLCSEKNLSHIVQNGGRFITVVPKDRKEVKQFRHRLTTHPVEFQEAYSVESSREKGKLTIYKTYEGEKTAQGFRLIWVHSSAKQEDDQARRQKKIDQALAGLEALAPKLNAYHLKTPKEIQAAVGRICKEVEAFVEVQIVSDRKQIKEKVSPGRPSLQSVYNNKWAFTYRLLWALNQPALLDAAKTDGLFPLITNTDLAAAEVLRKYKTQPFLEKRMYTQKTILEVAPVFLKKEKRIEAILFLYFVALMIVSLLERKIRRNMVQEQIAQLPLLPQGMKSKKPTWNNIRYFFRNVHLAQILRNGVCIQSTVKGLGALHHQIIHLLDVPGQIYSDIQENWWQFETI
jgi:transposase